MNRERFLDRLALTIRCLAIVGFVAFLIYGMAISEHARAFVVLMSAAFAVSWAFARTLKRRP